MIANIGCVAALSIGRWNSCEASSRFDLEQDRLHVHLRFSDLKSRPSMPHTNGTRWARAYDEEGQSDGSEKFVKLSGIAEDMSVDELERLIIAQLLEATPA
jgi:hypothetical protein